MSNLSDDLAQLRTKLDGDDQFMGAHQILKIRRPKKKVPSWANNDKKIQEFVRRSFPKMDTNTVQRQRAGRWVAIVYYYYRQNWGRLEIARKLGLSVAATAATIQRIQRAGEGQRTDGKGRRIGALGRPKSQAVSQTPFVETQSEPVS